MISSRIGAMCECRFFCANKPNHLKLQKVLLKSGPTRPPCKRKGAFTSDTADTQNG